jgi:hypothetical protein
LDACADGAIVIDAAPDPDTGLAEAAGPDADEAVGEQAATRTATMPSAARRCVTGRIIRGPSTAGLYSLVANHRA